MKMNFSAENKAIISIGRLLTEVIKTWNVKDVQFKCFAVFELHANNNYSK